MEYSGGKDQNFVSILSKLNDLGNILLALLRELVGHLCKIKVVSFDPNIAYIDFGNARYSPVSNVAICKHTLDRHCVGTTAKHLPFTVDQHAPRRSIQPIRSRRKTNKPTHRIVFPDFSKEVAILGVASRRNLVSFVDHYSVNAT